MEEIVQKGLRECGGMNCNLARPVVPNLFEVGEHLLIKTNSCEHYDGLYYILGALLVSSWEQFDINL